MVNVNKEIFLAFEFTNKNKNNNNTKKTTVI